MTGVRRAARRPLSAPPRTRRVLQAHLGKVGANAGACAAGAFGSGALTSAAWTSAAVDFRCFRFWRLRIRRGSGLSFFFEYLQGRVLQGDLPVREAIQRPAQRSHPLGIHLRRPFQRAPDLRRQDGGDDALAGLDADFQAILDVEGSGQFREFHHRFETTGHEGLLREWSIVGRQGRAGSGGAGGAGRQGIPGVRGFFFSDGPGGLAL